MAPREDVRLAACGWLLPVVSEIGKLGVDERKMQLRLSDLDRKQCLSYRNNKHQAQRV